MVYYSASACGDQIGAVVGALVVEPNFSAICLAMFHAAAAPFEDLRFHKAVHA